jgi:hypothetical protein
MKTIFLIFNVLNLSLIGNVLLVNASCYYRNEGNPSNVPVSIAPNNFHTILSEMPSVNVDRILCNTNPTLGGSIPSDIGLYTKLTLLLVY